MKKYLLLLLFSKLLLTYSYSQCGTVATKDVNFDINKYNAFLASRSSNQVKYIPLNIHIIKEDDGTGGISEWKVENDLYNANQYYKGTGIQFYSCGKIDTINRSSILEFNFYYQGLLLNQYKNPNVIDIFYFEGTVPMVCGRAYYPWLMSVVNYVAMVNNCAGNGSTLAHELGHALGLYHTHEWFLFGTEKVDGSNCSTAGDLLCDTPADPGLSGNVDYNCNYTGTDVDPNGQTYTPDPQNMMSYSTDNCRAYFSSDQHARMRYYANSTYKDYSCAELGYSWNPIPLLCNSVYNGTTVWGQDIFNSYSNLLFNQYGKEKVHKFTISTISNVLIHLTDIEGKDLNVILLRDSLDPNSIIAQAKSSISFNNLPVGTYYVVVDGEDNEIYSYEDDIKAGSYKLSLNCLGANLSDGTCINPIPLTCESSYNGSTYNGQAIFDDYSCFILQNGKEKIHEFTLSSRTSVEIKLNDFGGNLDLMLLNNCNSDSCIIGGDSLLNYSNLEPGTYYIVVDESGTNLTATSSVYNLSFRCYDLYEACPSTIPIQCGVTYNGDMVLNGKSTLNRYLCDNLEYKGMEVYHELVIQDTTDVKFNFHYPDSLDLVTIFLNDSCNPLSCKELTSQSSEYKNVYPGTYYFVVDGKGSDSVSASGSYTIHVDCSPIEGKPGHCDNPIELICGTSLTDSINDGQLIMNSYRCESNNLKYGQEKIYKFSIGTFSSVNIKISNLNSQMVLHLLTNPCKGGSCIGQTQDSLTFNNLRAGTYYLSVDSKYSTQDLSSNLFTLSLECTPNSQVNGTCANPIVLGCGDVYYGTVDMGQDTLERYSCDTNELKKGKEVIHKVIISDTVTFQAILSNTSYTFDLFLFSDSCNSSSCLAYGKNKVEKANLLPGVYYLAIDTWLGTYGDISNYKLNINCLAPTIFCSTPIEIFCGVPYSDSTNNGQDEMNVYGCDTSKLEFGKEKIHKLVLDSIKDVEIILTNLLIDLDIQLLTDSCDPSSCIRRNDNYIYYRNLPAGVYYISVDGYGDNSSASEGPYTIQVNCFSPNDSSGTCLIPIDLTCGIPYQGRTYNGTSDFNQYSCASQLEFGKEKIHRITIDSKAKITASLSNLRGVDLDVHILSSCDTSSCIARNDNIAIADSLPAGTYYIVVDGYGGDTTQQGTYTLTVFCDYIKPLACSEVFISEYIEGGGDNKVIELYNPTDSVINLLNYSIELYMNGSNLPQIINLNGIIQAKSTFIIANDKIDTNIIGGNIDFYTSSLIFNGNDAVALSYNGGLVDVIGVKGQNPGNDWNGGGVTTSNTVLVRKKQVDKGSFSHSQFDPSLEWDAYLATDFSNIGYHNSHCNFCEQDIADTICIGDSVYFNGAYIKTTGTYYDTVIGVKCDSAKTLSLFVLNSFVIPAITIQQVSSQCENDTMIFSSNVANGGGNAKYYWKVNGVVIDSAHSFVSLPRALNVGDSITCILKSSLSCASPPDVISNTIFIRYYDTTNITVFDTICEGDIYLLGGKQLDSTGIYKDTLQTTMGCDSIVEINLYVEEKPLVLASASDDTVGVNSTVTFNITGSNASSYYWDFGDNFSSNIPNVSHTYTNHGTFNVILTGESINGYCTSTDTLVIMVLNDVGLNEQYQFTNNDINVFPNPTKNVINILNKQGDKLSSLFVLDTKGNIVRQYLNLNNNKVKINLIGLSSGGYILKFKIKDKYYYRYIHIL